MIILHLFDGKLHPADATPTYAGTVVKWTHTHAVESCRQFMTSSENVTGGNLFDDLLKVKKLSMDT